ncbi:hypothetical protein HZH68_004237 [Vespula germanica]|uniref:Uncharacterized protein n=1 Tax=Vespula germanica TaxID=30212 RepID=A0A834KQ66_VESGE|nr:hypothetical protein HZH68_004237 [Vespula germanica]
MVSSLTSVNANDIQRSRMKIIIEFLTEFDLYDGFSGRCDIGSVSRLADSLASSKAIAYFDRLRSMLVASKRSSKSNCLILLEKFFWKEKGNLEFGELTTEDVKVRSMENEASKVPALTFAGSNISKEKRIVRRYWTTTTLRTRWEIQRYKISRTLSGLSSPFRSPSHYLLGK